MNAHFHTSIDNILFIGISAILVRALVKLVAGKMALQGGALGEIGTAIGGIIN